jgi:DNA-binding beta-propeller fold protein YncE
MSKLALIAALGVLASGGVAFGAPKPPYALVKSIPLGAPDKWDYVVFDGQGERVYVAHADRLAVIDAKTDALLGNIDGIAGGTHGTGLSDATGQGFTDDGRNGLAIAFDLKTLKITRRIVADKDADAIATDKATGHVFIVEGDPGAMTVIDPKTDTAVATIKVGEGMEYATGDDHGTIYVAGNGNKDLVRIDARTNTVTARWATPDCASPHGLAYDPAGRRLFMGCLNAKMMVVNASTGAVVAELPIGHGNDAVAFDSKRRRVFATNGLEGTISAFQQTSPDAYVALAPIVTAVSGRTMAVDSATGRLYVAAADTDPPASPGGRPRPRPGTLRLMILEPTN